VGLLQSSCHYKMKRFITVITAVQFLYRLSLASSAQQPLRPVDTSAAASRPWNFNFSSSAPHYFASVHGVLQQWSNTFFPNGHSIVPCEIPPLVKLFHGRMDEDIPASPEWVAFDMQVLCLESAKPILTILQRNGVRNNGRFSTLAYVHLPNHTTDQMLILRRGVRDVIWRRHNGYTDAAYMGQFDRTTQARWRVPVPLGGVLSRKWTLRLVSQCRSWWPGLGI
jgi:hypothetical protein